MGPFAGRTGVGIAMLIPAEGDDQRDGQGVGQRRRMGGNSSRPRDLPTLPARVSLLPLRGLTTEGLMPDEDRLKRVPRERLRHRDRHCVASDDSSFRGLCSEPVPALQRTY
jgi:hypothetical protein